MSLIYEQNKIMNEIKFLELQRQCEQFALIYHTAKIHHSQREKYKEFDKLLNDRTASHFRKLNGEYKKTDECFKKLEELLKEL